MYSTEKGLFCLIYWSSSFFFVLPPLSPATRTHAHRRPTQKSFPTATAAAYPTENDFKSKPKMQKKNKRRFTIWCASIAAGRTANWNNGKIYGNAVIFHFIIPFKCLGARILCSAVSQPSFEFNEDFRCERSRLKNGPPRARANLVHESGTIPQK